MSVSRVRGPSVDGVKVIQTWGEELSDSFRIFFFKYRDCYKSN